MALIALVDDDQDFTGLVSELLRLQGWDVVVCNEEDEAARRVRDEHVDLAILDLRMTTRESGWQILDELRSDRATRRVPIVVCSAAVDDLEHRREWLEERGIAALPKPFDIDELLRLVEAMLPGNGAQQPSTSWDRLDG